MSTEKFWTKSYDKHVKKTLDYPTDGLGTLLLKSISKFPEKAGGYFMNYTMSFTEMKELAERFATFLQKNGVGKGDVVAINLPNSPQFNIAHIGAQLIGAATSGVSPLLSDEEIAYQLNDSNTKAIVTLDAVYAKVLNKVLDDIPNLKIIVTTSIAEYMGFSAIKVFLGKLLGKIPKGKVKPWPGKNVAKFKEIMAETSIDYKAASIDVEKDLCVLQYTGGTTGRPKGTQLTHKNIISNMFQMNHWMNLEQGSGVTLSAFPYFHIAGMLVVNMSLYMGFSQILIANPRDTDHLIAEFIDKHPTIVANVPTLYNMIIANEKHKTIPKENLDAVIAYISGAAPFPVESIKEFEDSMSAQNKVLEVYGMTETSPLLTANPIQGAKKIGTVGLPFPDTDIQLLDLDSGKPVGVGERGEIVCKGPQVTKGYHNKPEANKKTIIDGWLHTGDVGVFDEDGYLKIVDRVKDMIIVSGFKVYSVHVEDVLTEHPDIELCALVGLKDPNRPGSEIVKAFIQLKDGVSPTVQVTESIKAYAEDKLSKYEKPKQWEFKDELPLTTVGKVLKRELRDQ